MKQSDWTPALLKATRLNMGLSQDKLAKLLRVSGRLTVGRWEKGQRAIPGPVTIALEFLIGKRRRKDRP